jgi:hypothetical protein
MKEGRFKFELVKVNRKAGVRKNRSMERIA